MGASSQGFKTQMANLNKPPTDCCPWCQGHFRLGKVNILWRDVVECLLCGNIWILRNEMDLGKWH
jgi:hypothetical protein